MARPQDGETDYTYLRVEEAIKSHRWSKSEQGDLHCISCGMNWKRGAGNCGGGYNVMQDLPELLYRPSMDACCVCQEYAMFYSPTYDQKVCSETCLDMLD